MTRNKAIELLRQLRDDLCKFYPSEMHDALNYAIDYLETKDNSQITHKELEIYTQDEVVNILNNFKNMVQGKIDELKGGQDSEICIDRCGVDSIIRLKLKEQENKE